MKNPYYKNFIKHRFPIHFGGLSDSFDYYERSNKTTLKVLKLMAELKYPCIFSTKGTLMAQGEYYEVLKQSAPNKNFIFQFSIITNNQEKDNVLSKGCPTIDERFEAMKKISDLGYWCVLRLRPFIIGASDDELEELFKKAHENGAKALSTEFYCYDIKLPSRTYREIDKVLGYNIQEYYKKLSPSERGGYRRLNRDVKETYIKRMWILCQKYNMQFNISDPDFKELNQSGSCCGIPEIREKYDSECVNWSKGQLTYFVVELMKRYLKGKKNLFLSVDEVIAKMSNDWGEDKKYWGDSLKCWNSDIQTTGMNHKKELIQVWNNTKSSQNPYNYFHGLLKPFKLDKNKNIIYKFIPPAYIKNWRKEGLI